MSQGRVARVLRAGHDLRARVRAVRDALRARASSSWAALMAWRWTPLVARCLLGALGLTLLAGIGRSALAGGTLSSSPGAQAPAPLTATSVAAPPRPPDALVAAATASTSSGPVASLPAALEDAGSGSAAQGATSRRATPDDPVILNQAAFEDLRRLPGVGPKRAQAILALRQRLGRFRQVEDLLKVKGIGRSTLRKLRPLVRLDPGAPVAPSS